MVATNAISIGYEMDVERHADMPIEGTFVVRFRTDVDDARGMRAMGKLGTVYYGSNGNAHVNRQQLEELQRKDIPHKIVAAPPGYKPPTAKTLRK
jgi:hypothetical protein